MKKICAFKHRKIQNMYLRCFFRSCHVGPHFAYALSLFGQFILVFDIPLSFSVLLSIFVMRLSFVMFLQSADPCRWPRGACQRSNCQQHGCFFLSVRKKDARKTRERSRRKKKLQEQARYWKRKQAARTRRKKKTSCKSTQDMQEESTGQEQTLESNKKKQEARGRSGGKTKIWKKKASCKNKDESRPGSCSLNYCLARGQCFGGRKAAIWSIISESYVSHNGLQVAGLFWPSLAWCFGVAKPAFWRPEGCDLEL